MKKNSKEKTGIEYMYDLYKATARKCCTHVQVCPELYPYARKLYECYKQPVELIDDSGKLIPTIKKKNDYTIFALSGGKDSLAVLLKNMNRFKNKIEGFHVLNINPLYPHEKRNIKKIAKYLNIKVYFINFPLNIHLWLPESIIKNQMIYAIMLEEYPYLPKSIGFGGTELIGPQSMAFFHDSKKAFDIFYKFAVKTWGTHKLVPFLKDEIESYKILYKKASPELRLIVGSCMLTEEYKKKSREKIKRKYKFEPPPNTYDCGSCYKCAEKAVIENKFFKIKYPQGYINECKKIILDKANNTIKMNGYPTLYLKKLGII